MQDPDPTAGAVPYARKPVAVLTGAAGTIVSFVTDTATNADRSTVASFGDEWTRFSEFDPSDIESVGAEYFDVVTNEMLGPGSTVLDIGCGSGRWARYVAPRVGFLEAVDPGDAVYVAAQALRDVPNARATHAGYGTLPFDPGSFDFVFSLGVVHHVPDTRLALREAAAMVRRGGHLLTYIYYSLDNRGPLFRGLFSLADVLRRAISRFPKQLRFFTCDLLAVIAYLPLVILASLVRAVDPAGSTWRRIPLSSYVGKSWRIIRNDALDRFGTPLEQRFSRHEIATMLEEAGLVDLKFSTHAPFWHVVGRKS